MKFDSTLCWMGFRAGVKEYHMLYVYFDSWNCLLPCGGMLAYHDASCSEAQSVQIFFFYYSVVHDAQLRSVNNWKQKSSIARTRRHSQLCISPRRYGKTLKGPCQLPVSSARSFLPPTRNFFSCEEHFDYKSTVWPSKDWVTFISVSSSKRDCYVSD